jgi:hypothetical protein
MWAHLLLKRWLVTLVAGVCLILNVGLVLEIVSALSLRSNLAQLEMSLFLVFLLVALPVFAVAVGQGIYLSVARRRADPSEAGGMRTLLAASVLNALVPVVFGGFLLTVRTVGYFWQT